MNFEHLSMSVMSVCICSSSNNTECQLVVIYQICIGAVECPEQFPPWFLCAKSSQDKEVEGIISQLRGWTVVGIVRQFVFLYRGTDNDTQD